MNSSVDLHVVLTTCLFINTTGIAIAIFHLIYVFRPVQRPEGSNECIRGLSIESSCSIFLSSRSILKVIKLRRRFVDRLVLAEASASPAALSSLVFLANYIANYCAHHASVVYCV